MDSDESISKAHEREAWVSSSWKFCPSLKSRIRRVEGLRWHCQMRIEVQDSDSWNRQARNQRGRTSRAELRGPRRIPPASRIGVALGHLELRGRQ
ncbi:hypothetical protein MPTK2_1g18120 [Marchantia polymorpha subsp. ruderalis]